MSTTQEPEVEIAEKPLGTFQGVKIKSRDGGYCITSERDHPVIEYDRTRYRLERDPSSTERIERFKIIPKT